MSNQGVFCIQPNNMITKTRHICIVLCILLVQLGCSSRNLTAEDITMLPVWKDNNTPAGTPSSCVQIGPANGSGKTDEDALHKFKLDVLNKGGNAATLLSGTRNIKSVTHAGLAYKCDPKQLLKYQMEMTE